DDPRYAAPRVGTAASIGYLAFLAGPPVVGFLADQIGVLHGLSIAGVLLAAALILCRATAPPRPPREVADHCGSGRRGLARISAPVSRPLGQANSKWSWRPPHQGTVVSAGRRAWRRTGEQARRLVLTVMLSPVLMIS